MNLTEFADLHLGTTGGGQGLGRAAAVITQTSSIDADRLESMLAAQLWRLADDYDPAIGPLGSTLRGWLLTGGASDLVVDPGARIPMLVVPHHDQRYDLLMFDPAMSEDDAPVVVPVDMPFLVRRTRRSSASRAWLPETGDFRYVVRTSRGWQSFLDEAVEFAAQAREYAVLIAPMPAFVPLAGCLAVSAADDPAAIGTIGVAAIGSAGTRVLTTARHVTAGHERLRVDGQPTRVMADDAVIDCAVLQAPDDVAESVPAGGSLLTFSPRAHEPATFSGASSGPTKTVVRAFDHTLLNPGRLTAVRVYTDADTRHGDSGAALFDADHRLMGFCCERTAFGATVECTTWIWAPQVVDMMKLSSWSSA